MTVPSRLRRFAARVLALGPVVMARRVMDTYGEAGGGLLAGGLTYAALFALLPGLLLLAAILGFAVDDPERRASLVSSVGDVLPPLRDLIDASIDKVTASAGGLGLLGLVGLAWGASHFYGALDEAFARIFRNAPRRGFVARSVRGVVCVLALLSISIGVLALTGIASGLSDERFAGGADIARAWRFATPVLAGLLLVGATAVAYVVIPDRPIAWRAAWLPALTAGALLAALTQLFSYVAPRLIGTAALFGAFVAIFAALIWLSTSFQVLLIGAAWVYERLPVEEESPKGAQPMPDGGAREEDRDGGGAAG